MAQLRASAHLMSREGAALGWLILVGSYLSSFLMLVLLDVMGWSGLMAIHAVYGTLAWGLYRWTQDLPTLNVGRVRRLHRWLVRLSEVLPEDAELDLDTTLGRAGCTGHSAACEAPWLKTTAFLPGGVGLEVRAVEGRSCPAVTRRIHTGTTLWVYCVHSPGGQAIHHAAASLTELAVPPGFEARTVEVDEAGDLIWTIEQREAGAESDLPIWPIARLRSLLEPADGEVALEPLAPGLRGGDGAALVRQAGRGVEERFALRRRGIGFVDLIEAEKARLVSALPHPSVALVSILLTVNALLGAALLTLEAVVQRPPTVHLSSAALASGATADLWTFVCAAAALVGVAVLSPGLVRMVRRGAADAAEDTVEVGQIDVRDTCLHLRPAAGAARGAEVIDLTRPFSVDLTRDRAAGRDGLRVHMTLRQRGREVRDVVVIGVSSEVDPSAPALALPQLGADYPEMDSADFQRLCEAVREASAAHGERQPVLSHVAVEARRR